MVSIEMQSMTMIRDAQIHKLLRAGKVDSEPTTKASAFVTDVIVIEGPA